MARALEVVGLLLTLQLTACVGPNPMFVEPSDGTGMNSVGMSSTSSANTTTTGVTVTTTATSVGPTTTTLSTTAPGTESSTSATVTSDTPTDTGPLTSTSGVGTSTEGIETTDAPGQILYDFYADHCDMEWLAKEENIFKMVPCNSINPDTGRANIAHGAPVPVEAGEVFEFAVEISPANEDEGIVSGTLDEVYFDQPAAFVSRVACPVSDPGCDVGYQVVIREDGIPQPIDALDEHASGDGEIDEVYFDLTPYAGLTLNVTMVVVPLEPSMLDSLIWEHPRIVAL